MFVYKLTSITANKTASTSARNRLFSPPVFSRFDALSPTSTMLLYDMIWESISDSLVPCEWMRAMASS